MTIINPRKEDWTSGKSKQLPIVLNPLPDMPILGSSNSAANKDVVSQKNKWTNGDTNT